MRKTLAGFRGVGFMLTPAAGVQAQVPAPDDETLARSIVGKADQVRFSTEGFEVGVTISTKTASDAADVRNTVVLTIEPASERGQILLMKGRDLWIFLPTVSQPVRSPIAASHGRRGKRRSRSG